MPLAGKTVSLLNRPCRHPCSTVTSTTQTALSRKPDCCSGRLLGFSTSLCSETETYLSLDRAPLQPVDFEALFEEHLKPFELRHEEAKAAATRLWRDYSAMSNRLDLLPHDSEEYRTLDAECDAAKVRYDEAHARVNLLYKEWRQERDRTFCVYCFKPMFLDVLVERLQGIAGSIISDIRRMKEGES